MTSENSCQLLHHALRYSSTAALLSALALVLLLSPHHSTLTLAQTTVGPTTTTFDPMTTVNATVDSGLDASAKELLLDMHNMYRRDERDATNMNRMEWSPFLEEQATKWAKQCVFGHQTEPAWGENLYRSTYKTTVENTINNGLLAWHLEQYNIMTGLGYIDCCSETKQTCCHFTQLIWAETEYVGCAIADCDLLKGSQPKFDYVNAWYLVCYYYPPGNVLTEQPYRFGKGACTECTESNPDCDRGLCYFDPKRC